MNSISTRRWLLAGVSPLCAMALALPAHAADKNAADANATATAETGPITNSDDTIFNPPRGNQSAPIPASVHTFEPQAIVSRSIIENSIAPTADYSQVLLL